MSPYVEVVFGEATKRTTTACGSNPFWNEELTLPFQLVDNITLRWYTEVYWGILRYTGGILRYTGDILRYTGGILRYTGGILVVHWRYTRGILEVYWGYTEVVWLIFRYPFSPLSSSPPHDDFSPTNLQRVTDVLYISLFDEVVIDILQVGGASTNDVRGRAFISFVCVEMIFLYQLTSDLPLPVDTSFVH